MNLCYLYILKNIQKNKRFNSIVRAILYTHSAVEQKLEMMLLPSSGFRVNGVFLLNRVTIVFTVISAVMLFNCIFKPMNETHSSATIN